MNDGRKRRRDKQVRRDARRQAKRNTVAAEPDLLISVLRNILATEGPATLLLTVGQIIELDKPDWRAVLAGDAPEPRILDGGITFWSGQSALEATALLVVLGEMLVDHEELQRRCRDEVARRGDRLPEWLAQLHRTQVYRAVRVADVLGDRDDVVLGVRLVGGHEFTVVATIDHLYMSTVTGIGVMDASVDTVLANVVAAGDPDNRVVDMTAADARAWLEYGMRKHYFPLLLQAESGFRVLLQWLVSRLPEGGQGYESPENWETTSVLLRAFFAAPRGAAFNHVFSAEELLGDLIDSGTGDPFRWSAARVRTALESVQVDDYSSIDSLSIVPDMLRSFIPVAHALSGIRSELTDRALAAIDQAEHGFRVRIAEEVRRWDEDWSA